MNAPELIQGSDEWLAFRRTKRNASESPMIMRASPFGGWQHVKDIKTGSPDAFRGNVATEHGQANEAEALAIAEGFFGQKFILGGVFVDGEYSASLDGMTADGKVIIEVKCPYRGKESKIYQAVMNYADPLYYRWQLQHQLMVTKADRAILFVYDAESGDFAHCHEMPSTEDQLTLRTQWDKFWSWMESGEPDPNVEQYVVRKDSAWKAAAESYRLAKFAADDASIQLENARQTLINLTETNREKGYGVSVIRSARSGAIDYKAALSKAAPDFDVSPFRKKDFEIVTVNVEK